jgi:hypothetical protein
MTGQRVIDVAETRQVIRQDTETCACTHGEIARCGLAVCTHPNRGIIPLPSRSDVAFWKKAQALGIIDPLVELWNQLGQPQVNALASTLGVLIFIVNKRESLGIDLEDTQANA